MKKILILLVIFVCFSTISLFAWEPSDLTKYPPCMTEKDWIINFGIGFGNFGNLVDSNYIYVPPIRLSFDRNVAMGEQKLPFFFGGIVNYSGHGYKYNHPEIKDYYYSVIGLGVRCGYHFNWGIDNLDTYAVATGGWAVFTGDIDLAPTRIGHPMIGANIGARWFINKNFGFWLETGYNTHSIFDIGLSFKF